MKTLLGLALALSVGLAACGPSSPPPPPTPPPAPKPEPAKPKGPPSDPTGKYKCLKCTQELRSDYKSNDKTCPRCNETIGFDEPAKNPATGGGTPGKSAVSVSYACGTAGCRYSTPNKGSACFEDGHPKCEKEIWYACAACKVESAQPGTCEKCSAELKKTLK
jgi:predicted nucleic acid-binding Zn ribbon protein